MQLGQKDASVKNGLVEFSKIGLVHSPSGRLLTSETFQGSLNVSGLSLKRKQIWTLFTEARNPTAFLLQNHLGSFLSADNNGKVALVDEHGDEERFLVHFDPRATGEMAIQSEASGFYLAWSGNEMRCFSKEPVWWGLRLAMHPQIHLCSVHRSCFIRSANNGTELRAVTKPPSTSKFVLWLEQLPLPSSRAPNCTKEQVARLSRVAIRTQSGRYLCSDGSLKKGLDKASLFAVSFKPSATPMVLFQDDNCEYLTVSAGGVVKVKMGAREPRREEFFAIRTPSIHVRIWAFNNKFACNKHGLTFSTTMEETEEHKSTIYQLEYVGGGQGLDMGAIVAAAATPSADSTPTVFNFDGGETGAYLTTGLWRLRSMDNRLWQIPSNGAPAQIVDKDCKDQTAFEILYVPKYDETDEETQRPRTNHLGGIVFRSNETSTTVCAKTLGAFGLSDRCVDANWQPQASEVLHMVTLVNRPSLAVYTPLACGYLAPGRGAGNVDCASTQPQQWYLKHLISGTVQMFTELDGNWHLLTATRQGGVALTPSAGGPGDVESTLTVRKPASESEFVICMTSDQHALFRAAGVSTADRPAFLCASLQGGIKLDTSGTIQPGCIWQI